MNLMSSSPSFKADERIKGCVVPEGCAAFYVYKIVLGSAGTTALVVRLFVILTF